MAQKLLTEPTFDSIRPALHRDLRGEDLDEIVEDPPRARRVGTGIFLFSLAFLAFLLGAYVVFDRLPPYEILKAAYDAGNALFVQQTRFDDPLQTDLWTDARTDARGVTVYDRERSFSGPTIFTSGHDAAAFLIDMDGRLIHSWRLPFSEVWDDSSVVTNPRADAFVYFDKAFMYPNGDLLAVYSGVGDTPWGLGLVKMDRDSRVIWKYLDRVHHDVEVGADQRVYALTHAMRDRPVEGMGNLELPMIEDFLVILSPDGEIERKLSLMDAVAASPYRKFFAALSDYARQDPLHTNAAKPVQGPETAAIGGSTAGGVLLSFRESGLIAFLDPADGRIVWATRGPWLGQHDPVLLPSGNILMFDNLGSTGRGGISRVIEFNPRTSAIEWSYAGAEDRKLESVLRSGQQRLSNGNTLITESDGGRLLEVTRGGDIVWEYVNPIRGGAGDRRIPVLSSGHRYAWSDLDSGLAAEWRNPPN